MRINEADVAELVDARDLKSLEKTCYPIDLTCKSADNFEIRAATEPVKTASKPANLQNNSRANFQLNKVTARGKKYVYIRGTDIALVKGFVGMPEDLERAIDQGISDYLNRGLHLVKRLRAEAAATLHKRTLARARAKSRPYFISAEIIEQMLDEAHDKCALTGLTFDYNEKLDVDDWWRRPLSPSLDRIDNSGGYELGNIRLVCTAINIGINEWGLANFDKICRGYLQNILEDAQP